MPRLALCSVIILVLLAFSATTATPVRAQQPTGMTAPPVGGMTTGIAGTTDIQALIAAQTFPVDVIWRLDIATQNWQSYIPGAPSIVNTLVLSSPSDIVLLRRAPGPKTVFPAAGPPCTVQEAAQTVAASTVKVLTNTGTGTAFYVGDSRFITAAHVVEGYASVGLEAVGLDLVAKVIGIDSASDVAVLEAVTSLPPLQWGDASSLETGQTLLIAGFPAGFGLSASVTQGLVSRMLFVEGQWLIQTDAAMSPGNSGGPAFDECGRVVGLVSSKIVDEAVEGIGFAIAESSVRAAIPTALLTPGAKATPTATVSNIAFHPVYEQGDGTFCASTTVPDNYLGFIGLCLTATYNVPVGSTLQTLWVRDGTVVCNFAGPLSQEIISGNLFKSCDGGAGASAVALRSGTYTVSFILSGTVVGTASRFISILRAPTSAEVDELVTLLVEPWNQAVDALTVLVALWGSLVKTEFTPSEALAAVARQSREIAAAMLGTAEGLRSHPGTANPTVLKFLSSGIEYWELQVQLEEAHVKNALGTLPWAQVQALQSAKASQFAAHRADGCAVAVFRGYTTWTFADGTPCR